MAKPKTSGTLAELRAMAYLYKRNILLYRPYDMGAWLVKEVASQKPALRIFYGPQNHFGSIFIKSEGSSTDGDKAGKATKLIDESLFLLFKVHFG